MQSIDVPEKSNPFESLDEELIIHIYQHAHHIFQQYEQLGHHLSTKSQVQPRDVTIQYRHLFGAGRKQTEYLFDMAAVSYLVRNFNGNQNIPSAEKLREMAHSAASETIAKLNTQIFNATTAANETNEIPSGPGINKTRSETRAKVDADIVDDASEWLADNINRTGSNGR